TFHLGGDIVYGWEPGVLFFFFQAEDGIRDRNVTGVQTCALPIYRNPTHGHSLLSDVVHGTTATALRHVSRIPILMVRVPAPTPRSEERRVGKEGRSRLGP